MPLGLQHSQSIRDRVSLQHLEWDNEGVREEVRVDCRVEDVDRTVVRSGEEEGEDGGEGDGAERTRVVAERLVGRRGQVEVVPDETLVVGSYNQVVCSMVR